MGARHSKEGESARLVAKQYESLVQDVRAAEATASPTSLPPGPSSSNTSMEAAYELSNRYKEGTFGRVLLKAGFAGAAGFLLGPVVGATTRALSVPVTALVVGSYSALFVGLYDLMREALTSVTLSETPLESALAGALTGYVCNGLVHVSKARAVAGAIAVGGIAGLTHLVMPAFHIDRAVTSTLLDASLLEDPDGRLARFVAAPPVLPPFSYDAFKQQLWRLAAGAGAAAFPYLPMRRVSDEEYARMMQVNPPMTISLKPKSDAGTQPELGD